MELENNSIVEYISSSDPSKQIQALLSLIQQFNAGKDVQNFVSTIISSVLRKTTNTTVKRFCYQLIKGCTLTNIYDWQFVEKTLVSDLNNKDSEVCTNALRSIVSIYGMTDRLVEFFNKHKECVFRKEDISVRIDALKLIIAIANSMRKSLKRKQYSKSVDLFGEWVLQSIQDEQQEVTYAAFLVLRDMICGNCVNHFHLEKLPVRVSKENMEWITFMSNHYSMLLSRVKSMDIALRYPALKPLTYISLFINQEIKTSTEHESINVTSILKPLLYSLECGNVLEAAHCILLTSVNRDTPIDITACTNNFIDDAINAYLVLLEREESEFSYEYIIRDVCCMLNQLRDKYSVCAKLIEHSVKMRDEENRMYVMLNIFRTIVRCCLYSKHRAILKNENSRFDEDSEIQKLFKEKVVQHCFSSKIKFEQRLRNEMLCCAAKEFLSIPIVEPIQEESLRAWLQVGIEICEQGIGCFSWSRSPGLNACIAKIGKILTKLCVETNTPPFHHDERKKVQSLLFHLLDNVPVMTSQYGVLISLCILTNYVPLDKKISGQEVGEFLYQQTTTMIKSALLHGGVKEKQKIDTLLYCLLCICLRFSIKLKDSAEFLETILNQRKTRDFITDSIHATALKIKYAMKYDVTRNTKNESHPDLEIVFGTSLNTDHPIFKSEFTTEDEKMLKNYISALQTTNNINSNLHCDDPFYFKNSSKQDLIRVATRQETDIRTKTMMVGQPSDPLSVTATYVLHPDEYNVLLHVKLHNTSEIDMYHVCVEIGADGPFQLFDRTLQATEIIGEFTKGSTVEFSRNFVISHFQYACFNIIVHCSPVKKTVDANLLQNLERHDIGRLTIRCKAFEIKPFHFLRQPKFILHEDFLTLWETFTSAFHKETIFSAKVDPQHVIERIMLKTPFTQVYHKVSKLVKNSTKLCYASRTIFGDYLLCIIYVNKHHSGVQICDWEFRGSSEKVIDTLTKNRSEWFSEITQGMTILQEGSMEKDHFDILQNVNDDLRISVPKSFKINEDQVKQLYLRKWKELRNK